MLSISRKTDYALLAMARMAQHSQESDTPLSCRDIADLYELPLQQLMGILKQLQRAGLLRSTRGPTGGYHLALPANQLPLSKIIEALEGPIKVAPCCDETEEEACTSCQIVPHCPITSSIRQINGQIQQVINQYTLADLLVKPDFSPIVELVVN